MAARRTRTELTCQQCGKKFYPKGGSLKQKNCSRECSNKSLVGRTSKKKGVEYPHLRRARIGTCIVCGKEFRATKDFNGAKVTRVQKYCNKECWENRGHRENKTFVCIACKKVFVGNPYDNRKYCSRECGVLDMVGEKAASYKDGKSLLRDRARHSHELVLWRESVFERDGYKCTKCGDGGTIQAHHIEHWATTKSLRFEISNGTTLCIKCHGKEHNRDFSKRVPKTCSVCGTDIKNKTNTGLCHSCAAKKNWALRKGKKATRPDREE